ncbi:MAG: bifunctional diaminohydroxyphosphoribosylaminopyrimidine deaminase/5-amino-6-(5-phosphoribosylamino)uracil reductase RibD [Ignavibacteria bacterium]|nr:MAG: bifunctional diaminohydroxyphosphoribosylaminopyrimidine deaminase/5-amino-6-(5-phosphoribosylamino)uracil reductase RibD [Ignavibacteria bacterium]
MKFSKEDLTYIKRCFELAEKGRGFVSPNPLVGTVIVKDGHIIGEGWHKNFGGAHAEVNAAASSNEEIKGATLYCNLEPCCHTNKQTPPCVPLIISKEISRVVISDLDPNLSVNGNGVKQLKEAGIRVDTGILEDEGKEVNKFYFKYVIEKVPYITIKIAQSIDGKISAEQDTQTWLTGEESVKYVHHQRNRYDAVLVGANTIKVDDPWLTVREVDGRNPIRIIIDGDLSISPGSKIIKLTGNKKTWIFTAGNSHQEKIKQFEKLGIKIFQLPADKKKLELGDMLKELGKENITSLLVEGGQQIFSQFISQSLFDDIIILQSPKFLGKGISAFESNGTKKLKIKETERLGEDLKIVLVSNQ